VETATNISNSSFNIFEKHERMIDSISVIKSGRIGNWVNGAHVASDAVDYVPLITPYTGQIIGECPLGGSADLDRAVAAAAAAFPAWKKTHIKERVQVMFRLKNLLEENIDELANLAALECGKLIAEAKAGIMKGVEILEYACSVPNKIADDYLEVSNGISCRISREPQGVIASIAPFNFPNMVPMWTLPIALVCGNTAILKPSEQVPLSALKLAELFSRAGLPNGVLNVVNGGVEMVEAICDHPDIAALSFVGSSKVAKIVYSRGSAKGKPVLALGGAKNHLLVMADADPDFAPEQIVNSVTGCAGQRCMAASTIITVGECGHLIEKMVTYAQSFDLGRDMGAVINAESVKRITSYIDAAEAAGAKVLVDGRNKTPIAGLPGCQGGCWMGPTILDNLTPDMPAACEEIFGPVMTIIRVKTLEEALAIENANPYGNAASIFTSSGAPADYLVEHASAGMIGVNIGVPVPREPFSFGGWNDSKFGSGDITGQDGIDFWTKKKKVTTKWVYPKNPDWMS
jgi:malonate-semialdehyde dehydrogenase (acetylating)/methylmalonate-semialdehyde dehydrogenase